MSDLWVEWTIAIFFVTLSNNFLGTRQPAINYSRELVQAYARVGMYQKNITMLQTAPARMRTSPLTLLANVVNYVPEAFLWLERSSGRTFGTRHITHLGQGEGAHIVLINNVGLNIRTLGLEKLMCPKYVARFVIQSDNLAFVSVRPTSRYVSFGRKHSRQSHKTP